MWDKAWQLFSIVSWFSLVLTLVSSTNIRVELKYFLTYRDMPNVLVTVIFHLESQFFFYQGQFLSDFNKNLFKQKWKNICCFLQLFSNNFLKQVFIYSWFKKKLKLFVFKNTVNLIVLCFNWIKGDNSNSVRSTLSEFVNNYW